MLSLSVHKQQAGQLTHGLRKSVVGQWTCMLVLEPYVYSQIMKTDFLILNEHKIIWVQDSFCIMSTGIEVGLCVDTASDVIVILTIVIELKTYHKCQWNYHKTNPSFILLFTLYRYKRIPKSTLIFIVLINTIFS